MSSFYWTIVKSWLVWISQSKELHKKNLTWSEIELIFSLVCMFCISISMQVLFNYCYKKRSHHFQLLITLYIFTQVPHTSLLCKAHKADQRVFLYISFSKAHMGNYCWSFPTAVISATLLGTPLVNNIVHKFYRDRNEQPYFQNSFHQFFN